jgi:uncharacterized membrane-anchored protein
VKPLQEYIEAIIGNPKGAPRGHSKGTSKASIKGLAKLDSKTKNLVSRLKPGDIAIINHNDLDEIAGKALVAARVKAVVNCGHSISGKYPNLGPQALVDADIILVDEVGPELMTKVQEGEKLRLTPQGEIYSEENLIGSGKVLGREEVQSKMRATKEKLGIILDDFVQNTLEYAQKERSLVLGQVELPPVETCFQGRHTLIVVRGKNYREDLKAIKTYLAEVRPILIGVDGGADALLEFGCQPDLIIGDMDSVSDRALSSGAELVVHAYPDGRAPGLNRITRLGLRGKIFPAPGTSEDIAMLLAYELGTELIVAVGTHSNMIDFLEKGRQGMASTFLVRLKVGGILVDAKGVSKLYNQRLRFRYLAQIVGAAMVPMVFIVWLAPSTRHLVRLAYLQLKLVLGL